ncbi:MULTISPECIES: hypothetical protein [unclassified Geodermatophilus]|uniref:hypothetical protein n=1 Tax=unclassified Geodermatophilus TaxID=2637632 RepID=UPI003EEAAC8A
MTGPNAADDPVQNPLTLVMTLRSPEERRTLQGKLEALQSLPREQNPIIAALDKIATVHFARFVFLDEQKLAVITTYDGDFDAYVNEFVDHIGDVFNDLLQHMDSAPPLPVQRHRQEFLDYVRRNDLRCLPPFYSAYPDRTVLDILAADSGS